MLEYERNPADGKSVLAPGQVKVIGIGGAGSNVLDRIALEGMEEAELLTLNTDVRALNTSVANDKIQMGKNLTQGLGAGGDPERGAQAAEEAMDEIRAAVEGKSLVFICVGLGGGTGSGAAPVVAKLARQAGAFVVAFVTVPFSFEGRRRISQAQDALAQLESCTNGLVTFDNDRMGGLVLPTDGIQQAFSAADQIISQSVRAITKLVSQPGLVRIGMDDLLSALKNDSSRCLFGFGQAQGENRAQEALKGALKSPLLDQGRMLDYSSSLIAHVCGGENMTLFEVELLMDELSKHVNDDAHILFGAAADSRQGENLSVTIISSVGAEVPISAQPGDQPEVVAKVQSTTENTLSDPELEVAEQSDGEIAKTAPDEDLELDSEKEPEPEPLIPDESEDVVEVEEDPDVQQEEDPEPDVQEELLPEKQSGGRGRFDKVEPTVVDGEDLDVPSFLRKKKK